MGRPHDGGQLNSMMPHHTTWGHALDHLLLHVLLSDDPPYFFATPAQILGEVGRVQKVFENGDLRIKFSSHQRWTLSAEAVTKVSMPFR